MGDSTQFPEGQLLMEIEACQPDVGPGSSSRSPTTFFKAMVTTLLLSLLGTGACAAQHTGWAAKPHRDEFSSEEVMAASQIAPLGPGFCGVKGNPHLCPELLGVLAHTGSAGADKILCMDNMAEEACQLDTMFHGWEKKDPTECKDRTGTSAGLLFLWDTPDSINADPSGFSIDILCGGSEEPCPAWAAKAWMEYVDKWRPKLAAARRLGMQVSSPRFSGDVMGKLRAFFQACSECSQAGSPYYIDVLAFNDGINSADAANGFAHIKDVASQIKAAFANRPVVLSNLYVAASAPSGEANVIVNSGVFDRAGNPLDAVYWSVYPQGFSDPLARSLLKDVVESGPQRGKTLGKVLVEKCGLQ